jgi:hypothetical protein
MGEGGCVYINDDIRFGMYLRQEVFGMYKIKH